MESKPIDTRPARPASIILWIALVFFVLGGMFVVPIVLGAVIYLAIPKMEKIAIPTVVEVDVSHSHAMGRSPTAAVDSSFATDQLTSDSAATHDSTNGSSASPTATVPKSESGSSPHQPAHQ